MERLAIMVAVFIAIWVLPIKVQPKQLLWVAFTLWFIAGMMLTVLGILRIQESPEVAFGTPVFYMGITVAAILGLAKGKFVLSKTSKQNIERISDLEGPVRINQVYSKKSWMFVLGMMGLAVIINLLGIDPFYRGVVNIGIGASLLASSMLYLFSNRPDVGAPTSTP